MLKYLYIIRPILLVVLISISSTNSSAQTASEYIETLEIDTLLNNGPKDNRINIIWGNIKANESDNPYPNQESFNESLAGIIETFDPNNSNVKNGFSQYHNFFNFFSAWFPDPIIYEPQPQYYLLTQAIRDELFLPWATERYGWVTMIYTGGGGNGTGLDRNRRVGDGTSSIDWETALHEFNHTMPGLFDEYTASGEWSNYVCIDGPNVSGVNDVSEVPWRNWIDDVFEFPTPYEAEYFNKVGLFEGNISGYFGCYRPTAQSCYMGAGGFGEEYGQELCPVCLQRFICMLYQYVNVIENPFPSEPVIQINGAETIEFSADFIKPEPNTQHYTWFLNDVPIETNQESISVNFDACDSYVLKLVVTDTTDFVRYDPKFENFYPKPEQTHEWVIEQNAVSGYDLAADFTLEDANCKVNGVGIINVSPSGGTAPYSYYMDGKEVTNPIESAPGFKEIIVADGNGCSVQLNVEVTQTTVIEFEICSSYISGEWTLSPSFSSSSDNISYLWSNGSTNSEIIVTAPDTYTLMVSDENQCEVTKEITLNEQSEGLTVQSSIVHTSGNDDGAIYLNLLGNLDPTSISWYAANPIDLTTADESKVFISNNGLWTQAVYAFDNSFEYNENFWMENFNGANYVGFDFQTQTTINGYSILSNIDTKERDGKAWEFQGSNDGINWDVLDQVISYDFTSRLEYQIFTLDNPATYQYFRLFFTENWGSDLISIQEMEFFRFEFNELLNFKNNKAIVGKPAGVYRYEIVDNNQACAFETIEISNVAHPSPVSLNLTSTNYLISIDNPLDGIEYFWTSNSNGSGLLNVGIDFQPEKPGNYYVRAYDPNYETFASNLKGFSVTMEPPPIINYNDTSLYVENPDDQATYFWYDTELGGTVIHTGPSFRPTDCGSYYVSAFKLPEAITSIDPSNISGIQLWMDASDLNADGITDEGLKNFSGYDWNFLAGGSWGATAWFPYRAFYQNGLGVADFATMWYQGLDGGAERHRTVIMAYQESSLSFDKSAPFYGLENTIPRHSDETQLFSNSAPSSTLNGKTYLNGKQVDPLTTPNPMDFIVLSVVYTETINEWINASHMNWEGKLGELIIWDIELSDEQLKGVNEYLRKKWLSSAHLESTRTKVDWGFGNAFDLGEDKIICGEGSTIIDAGPGFTTYIWNNGSETQTIEVSEAGTYYVEASHDSGCKLTDQVTVYKYELPTVDLGSDLTICNGVNAMLNAGTGFESYLWNTEETTQSIEVTSNDKYSVIVTDSIGCTATDEVIVTCIVQANYEKIDIKIYPNPVAKHITITGFSGLKELQLISISGKTEFVELISSGSIVDLSRMVNGMYIIRLDNKIEGKVLIE